MTHLDGRDLERVVKAVGLIVFDFDGVFTDNTVYVSQDGVESVRCWRGDGLGLRKLDKLGVQAVIVSTEVNPVVSARATKLRLRCEQGVDDKAALVASIASDLGFTLDQVAFVGNDINDVACMKTVGLPIAVADAHPDVSHCVRYRTSTPGGRGAVREICDLFERVRES